MARQKVRTNPFYVVLVVVGVLFAITAFAYCVMAFRAVSSTPIGQASMSGESLMQILDQYGMWLMLGEVVLLAIATFGAIGTDNYWTNPATKPNIDPSRSQPESKP